MPVSRAAAAALTDQPTYIGVMGLKGRDRSDTPFLVPEDQCLEAYNVDWFQSSLGRKRGGASALGITGGTAMASGVLSIARHVPADDQTLAEMWAVDGALKFHRLAAGTAWADPTVLDAITATAQEVAFQSFNGKLYVAYKNGHNRLHAWDGSTLRRVGLDQPAVAASTVLAGGAVTDTRRYRIAWTKQVAGVTTYRSNLGTATGSIVLAAQQVTVTRPAAAGEGETHWELYGAASPFTDYRLVATTVIATTTAVDNAALPATVALADGAQTPPPSCRYMAADDARLIMAGAYEASTAAENAMTPSVSRVWWTSVLGAGTGDDERVSNTGTINSYADLEEAITGLSQPMQVVSAAATSLERGSFYVFSFESQWKFIATGIASAPYTKLRITGGGGCIHHKSIVTAIDSNGNPAVYWASKIGPMRICLDGQQFLGEDIVDVWDTVNLDATIPCHTVYYPALRQVWFYLATGTSMYPNKRVIFDTRFGRVTDISGVRKGWALHEGESTKAYCSCLFSGTVGASMSRKLKPYIGYTTSTAIWKCDTTDLDDAGTAYQAYIDSRSYAPWGLNRKGGMSSEAMLISTPQAGVTLRLTIYRDEGSEALVSDANLTDFSDSGAAARVFPIFEDSKLADSFSFRCRIGDAQAIASTWNLDGLIIPVTRQGDH